MKLLFVYDDNIKKDNNGSYYGISLNDSVLDRYKYISENLTTIVRVTKLKENDDFTKLSKITSNVNIIGTSNLMSIKGLLLSKLSVKKTILEEVKKSDGVICRLPSMNGFIAAKYAKKYNKPYLVEVVGCPWDSLWNHSIKGKLLAPYMVVNTKKIVKNAPFVLYVTEKFLQKRYPNKNINISCSDVVIKENIINKKIENLNYEKKDHIILGTTAGIDVRYKGQEYVIKAIARLNKEGYKYIYKLAGGGDKTYLYNIAKKYNVVENIIFEGAIPHDNINSFYNDLDIYIQPSKQEGLPRALVEAMSCGCPCIASNAGGNIELLDSEFIFSKGNVDELVNCLKKMTINNMKKQSKINFEKSKEYSEKDLRKKRLKLYEQFSSFINNSYKGELNND